MVRSRAPALIRAFEHRDIQILGKITVLSRCKACGLERSARSDRDHHHIKTCVAIKYAQSALVAEHSQVRLMEQDTTIKDEDDQYVYRITPARMARLHALAAEVIYRDARAFTIFHTTSMQNFLLELNPAFRIPSVTAFRTKLLDASYNKHKIAIDMLLKGTANLSFSSDGSTDNAHHGVTNLAFVHPTEGSFVLWTHRINSHDDSAAVASTAMKDQLRVVTEGNWVRISSLAFDTCPTQLAIFNIFEVDKELEHVITVLCDAHGLSLALKDAMKLPWFTKILDDCQQIAVAVTRSNQQHFVLQEHAKRLHPRGAETKLQAQGDTRWTTLIRLLRSIIKLKLAFKEMVEDARCKLSEDIVAIINSRTFWRHLIETHEVVRIFDNAVIAAQAASNRMNTVLPRWYGLQSELLELQKADDFDAPIAELVWGSEDIRANRRDRRTITGK